jgi:hypothetical protein
MFSITAWFTCAYLSDSSDTEPPQDIRKLLKGKMQRGSNLLKRSGVVYDHYTPIIGKHSKTFSGINTLQIHQVGHDPDYGDSFSVTAGVWQEPNTHGYILSKSVRPDTDESCFGFYMSSFAHKQGPNATLAIKLRLTYGSHEGVQTANRQVDSARLVTENRPAAITYVAASLNGTHVRFFVDEKQLGSAVALQAPLLVCPGGTMFAGMRAPESDFFTGRIKDLGMHNDGLTQDTIVSKMALLRDEGTISGSPARN